MREGFTLDGDKVIYNGAVIAKTRAWSARCMWTDESVVRNILEPVLMTAAGPLLADGFVVLGHRMTTDGMGVKLNRGKYSIYCEISVYNDVIKSAVEVGDTRVVYDNAGEALASLPTIKQKDKKQRREKVFTRFDELEEKIDNVSKTAASFLLRIVAILN